MAEEARLTPAIACDGLSKAFGANLILRSVSCAVPSGSTLAVLGRSGSGKSTFLRLLALLEAPDAGDAWLRGQQYIRRGIPLLRPERVRRRVAMVFQLFNLFPNLTVLENCTLGPVRSLGMERRNAAREARELLEALQLQTLAARFPETLSGGEAQRVALARALLMHPEVLLLDEVTSSLDPESIIAVLRTIRTIRSLDQGRELTIVLVTHLLAFAQSFATTIAYLHGGELIDVLPAAKFSEAAQSTPARSFVHQARSQWTADA
jgi:ABC-type polar amino acid transport system ATPase subunit